MIEREIADFDLEQIARSGQCFRFRELGEKRYSVVAGGKYIEVCPGRAAGAVRLFGGNIRVGLARIF